jgi:hypothetical protein
MSGTRRKPFLRFHWCASETVERKHIGPGEAIALGLQVPRNRKNPEKESRRDGDENQKRKGPEMCTPWLCSLSMALAPACLTVGGLSFTVMARLGESAQSLPLETTLSSHIGPDSVIIVSEFHCRQRLLHIRLSLL